MGVKKGFPLSPTLFGLYIDKLKEWINMTNREGIQLVGYVVRLLYVDDLILITKTSRGLMSLSLKRYDNIILANEKIFNFFKSVLERKIFISQTQSEK